MIKTKILAHHFYAIEIPFYTPKLQQEKIIIFDISSKGLNEITTFENVNVVNFEITLLHQI